MKQIFILGAYGHNNLGDDALLQVFIQQFGEAQLLVNSARPAETARRFGVKTVHTYLGWPRFSRLRALISSDLIIFGGGSLLKEIEGTFLGQFLYFLRILLILAGAKLAGRPTVMLGVGMGPLKRPFFQKLARLAANLTSAIYVRDSESALLLQQIGARGSIHVTADAVFLLQPKTGNLTSIPVARPYAVAIPRYSFTPLQQAAFSRACDYLVERYALNILLVPFQTGYSAKFDDKPLVEAIKQQMQHSQAAQVWLPETPETALEVIGQAELVLSSRLHGLIFAATRGIPLIAINYEVKVQNFMEELGQENFSLSLKDLENEKLPPLLDRVWQERAELRLKLLNRVQQFQAIAQSSFEAIRSYRDIQK